MSGARIGPENGPENSTEIGAATARLLHEAGAIQVSQGRPYILAAGWASPVYVDVRRLIGTPRTARAMTDLAARAIIERIGVEHFALIAGAETAGIPLAAWLSDRLERGLRYVRKRRLGFGNNAAVEGGAVEGHQVLLVDDLATDGASKIGFLRGLREAGAQVSDILVVFFNNSFPGTPERLAGQGATLHSLATWQDVLAADLLKPADADLLRGFLADPVGWSTSHGGRTQG